jgi:hypothetical protein
MPEQYDWEAHATRVDELDRLVYEECPDCKGSMRAVGHTDHYDDPIADDAIYFEEA